MYVSRNSRTDKPEAPALVAVDHVLRTDKPPDVLGRTRVGHDLIILGLDDEVAVIRRLTSLRHEWKREEGLRVFGDSDIRGIGQIEVDVTYPPIDWFTLNGGTRRGVFAWPDHPWRSPR